MPPGASPHCLDLLRRIMTVDSEKRITIPEIMRHPWFLEDLPLGLEEANSSLLEAPLALQFCKQSEVIGSCGALHSTLPCSLADPLWSACPGAAAEPGGGQLQPIGGAPGPAGLQPVQGE